MKKSSRFWWLHGAILLSAVIGCKSANSCGNSYGGPAGGPPVVSGNAPIMSGSPMTTTTTYPPAGASGMPSYSGSSMQGGQSFGPSSGGGYPSAGMSSMAPSFGSGMH
jgi:hypothetical protein